MITPFTVRLLCPRRELRGEAFLSVSFQPALVEGELGHTLSGSALVGSSRPSVLFSSAWTPDAFRYTLWASPADTGTRTGVQKRGVFVCAA